MSFLFDYQVTMSAQPRIFLWRHRLNLSHAAKPGSQVLPQRGAQGWVWLWEPKDPHFLSEPNSLLPCPLPSPCGHLPDYLQGPGSNWHNWTWTCISSGIKAKSVSSGIIAPVPWPMLPNTLSSPILSSWWPARVFMSYLFPGPIRPLPLGTYAHHLIY